MTEKTFEDTFYFTVIYIEKKVEKAKNHRVKAVSELEARRKLIVKYLDKGLQVKKILANLA